MGTGQLRQALSRGRFLRRVRATIRRRLQVYRQDRPPQRLGDLLHAGVLSRLGRWHFAGRVLDHAVVQHQSRRHSAGVLPRAGPAPELRAAPGHPVRLQERPGYLVPPDRRQQASVLAPMEHHRGPRAPPQHVAERGVRGQRGTPVAVEHRSDQRDQPELPVHGRQALRPVQAWHDEPQWRAASLRRLGGADDGLRAFGCAGAASVSAGTATTCRA